jgi:hypothetical protein
MANLVRSPSDKHAKSWQIRPLIRRFIGRGLKKAHAAALLAVKLIGTTFELLHAITSFPQRRLCNEKEQ